jgi:hypothetical protein
MDGKDIPAVGARDLLVVSVLGARTHSGRALQSADVGEAARSHHGETAPEH